MKNGNEIEKWVRCYWDIESLGMATSPIWKKIEPKIKLIERKDWIKHQICGDFPIIDLRCFVFCCSPSKKCPFRELALRKIGLTAKDYIKMKKFFANSIMSAKIT